MNEPQIRDAATVILLRDPASRPHVLMGQRGHAAAFMPNKFVFPGGALDPADRDVSLASPLPASCMDKLQAKSDETLAEPLVLAAIRELWEETGLMLGEQLDEARTTQAPADWRGFFAQGIAPSAANMRFVFRAITPPGRTRRFDARFFLANTDQIVGDIDDFSQASDELRHLQWIPLDEARSFDLPFITEVVLAEIQSQLETPEADHQVPFFYNEEGRSHFMRL